MSWMYRHELLFVYGMVIGSCLTSYAIMWWENRKEKK